VAINKKGDKWVLDWWAEGKRYRKFFETRKAADNHRTEIKKKKKDGAYVAPDKVPSFRETAAAWPATRADRAEGTYDQYAGHVSRHLLPRFGDLRLDQISSESIAAMRAELGQTGKTNQRRKGMAPATVTAIVKSLSSIFESAVRTGRLASNPVMRLERPYNRAREGQREDIAVHPDEILNPDEIRRLLAAAERGLYWTLFMLAAATGARSGELLALRWSDITFDGKSHISIRRSLSWAKGPNGSKSVARFGPCKTNAGARDIPIDASVALALKAWKLQAGRNELDLVFADSNGIPMQRSLILKYGFRHALKRAGLRRVKFHSLRHSFASALIKRAPVTEVQHLLGHKDPGITLRVYSHWFKGEDSGAAAAYTAELFSGIDTK